MKRLSVIFTLLAILLIPKALQANESAQGWCEKGGVKVALGGLTSTSNVQVSYVQCTVTVYVHGTVTLATLYSNNNSTPTPLANPFTATALGHWQFYSTNGSYDVILNGGGFSSPFTISDIILGGFLFRY